MADNATALEIQKILKQIQEIKDEVISLPSDVSIGHSTDRPELLKVVSRSMTEAEVRAVLDVLAGEMRLRKLYEHLNHLRCEIIEDVLLTVNDLERGFDKICQLIQNK